MPSLEVWLFCFLIGTINGVIGIGGFLIIPVLQYSGHLTPQGAVATTLFGFLIASVPGVVLSRRLFRIDRSAVLVSLGALLAGYVGARLNYILPATVSRFILACVLIVASGFGFARLRGPAASARGEPPEPSRNGAAFLGVGVTTGLLSGMTGVGGPVVAVPLLGMLRVGPGTILACSQLVTLLGSASATAGNIALGAVSFKLGALAGLMLAAGLCVGLVAARRLIRSRAYPVAVAVSTLLSGLYFIYLAYR